MSDEAIKEFLDHFEGVEDPRIDNANRRHELGDMLVLTILAVICGADSWAAVEDFGKAKRRYLKCFLKLPKRYPLARYAGGFVCAVVSGAVAGGVFELGECLGQRP